MSNMAHLKAGLNLSKFTGGNSDMFKTGIGYHLGTGIQITPNLGVDIGYVSMRQTADVAGMNVDVDISGFEIGLTGTF